MVMVAFAYAAGLLLAHWFTLPVTGLFGLGLAVAGLALASDRLRPWLLGVLLPVAGGANLTWREAVLSPHDLRVVMGEEPEIVTLEGRLVATPSPRLRLLDEQERWRTLAVLDASAVARTGSWQAV
jgi:hypothetical protein